MLIIVLSILFDNLNLRGRIISIFPYDNSEAKVLIYIELEKVFISCFFDSCAHGFSLSPPLLTLPPARFALLITLFLSEMR